MNNLHNRDLTALRQLAILNSRDLEKRFHQKNLNITNAPLTPTKTTEKVIKETENSNRKHIRNSPIFDQNKSTPKSPVVKTGDLFHTRQKEYGL